MAKVTITLEDGKLDGEVKIDLDFHEDVDMPNHGTAAQHVALEMIQAFQLSRNVSEMELMSYDE